MCRCLEGAGWWVTCPFADWRAVPPRWGAPLLLPLCLSLTFKNSAYVATQRMCLLFFVGRMVVVPVCEWTPPHPKRIYSDAAKSFKEQPLGCTTGWSQGLGGHAAPSLPCSAHPSSMGTPPNMPHPPLSDLPPPTCSDIKGLGRVLERSLLHFGT